MSEQAAEELENEGAKPIEEEEKPTTAEDVAREGGWKPLEEWEGESKDWRSAEVFNERGEWIQRHKVQQKQIDDMQSTFNTRMDNANKLHQQQIDTQKAELVRKRDEAIDLADREKANSYQSDIDNLNTQIVEPANNGQSVFDAWNQSNPWIMQGTPKAAYAIQQCAKYQSQGMKSEDAIAATESDVNREFPALNPNRDKHPSSEGGSKPGKKRAARKLSMSDLTSEELKYYRLMPGAWKTEADYLQAVQDTRGDA